MIISYHYEYGIAFFVFVLLSWNILSLFLPAGHQYKSDTCWAGCSFRWVPPAGQVAAVAASYHAPVGVVVLFSHDGTPC